MLREVYLSNTGANAETLANIARSLELEVLHIGGSEITDAGIKASTKLKELRAAILWDTHIGDTHIGDTSTSIFATLPKLKQLYL